jgi:hypothetical protein
MNLYPKVYHKSLQRKQSFGNGNYVQMNEQRHGAIRRQLARNPDLFNKVSIWSQWLEDARAAIATPYSAKAKAVSKSKTSMKMTMKPWSAEYGAYGKLCRFCKCIEKLCIH